MQKLIGPKNIPLQECISFFSMAQQHTFIEEQKLVSEVAHLHLILHPPEVDLYI